MVTMTANKHDCDMLMVMTMMVKRGTSLMLWAQSATKDYIRVEHKLQSISRLFIPQVIITQVSFSQTTTQILSTISEHKPRKTITHVLESIHIPRALNTGTCIQQDDLFYSDKNIKIGSENCSTLLWPWTWLSSLKVVKTGKAQWVVQSCTVWHYSHLRCLIKIPVLKFSTNPGIRPTKNKLIISSKCKAESQKSNCVWSL